LIIFILTWLFVGAPHVRYVWAPLLLMGALLLAWAWQTLDLAGQIRISVMNLVQVLVGIELILAVMASIIVVLPRLSTNMPTVEVSLLPLSSTVDLQVPSDTDQCWDNYPVCSGMPAAGLALRGETIAEGFRHTPIE
jgi:hypothetical protein